jgi:hypothetical protein
MYAIEPTRVKWPTENPSLAFVNSTENPIALAFLEQHRLLWPEIPSLVVSNHSHRYEAIDIPVMGELAPGLAGRVFTGLAMAQTEWVFVVSDAFCLTHDMLTALWVARTDFCDAVLADSQSPTGLYRRDLVFEWELRMWSGPSLMSLLRDVRVKIVDFSIETNKGVVLTTPSSEFCYEEMSTHGEDI